MNGFLKEKKENVVAGIVGAFLFSLAGAVVWVLLDLVGFYAAISGLVGVVCAIQGYKIFAGVLSKKGVIIASVIALLVLVLAWYGCFVKDLHDAYKGWYENGDVDYMPTYFQCFGIGYNFFSEPEIAKSYFLSLGMGLVFAVIGGLRYIINAFKSAGNESGANAVPETSGAVPFSENPPAENFGLQSPDNGDQNGGDNNRTDL